MVCGFYTIKKLRRDTRDLKRFSEGLKQDIENQNYCNSENLGKLKAAVDKNVEYFSNTSGENVRRLGGTFVLLITVGFIPSGIALMDSMTYEYAVLVYCLSLTIMVVTSLYLLFYLIWYRLFPEIMLRLVKNALKASKPGKLETKYIRAARHLRRGRYIYHAIDLLNMLFHPLLALLCIALMAVFLYDDRDHGDSPDYSSDGANQGDSKKTMLETQFAFVIYLFVLSILTAAFSASSYFDISGKHDEEAGDTSSSSTQLAYTHASSGSTHVSQTGEREAVPNTPNATNSEGEPFLVTSHASS